MTSVSLRPVVPPAESNASGWFKKQDVALRTGMLLVCLLGLAPAAPAQPLEPLPGTAPLTLEGDLSLRVVERVDSLLLRMTEASVAERQRWWHPDYTSAEAYAASTAPNRARFRRYTGVVDERLPFEDLALVAALNTPALVGETERFRAFAVRWPVLEGVDAEGLLLEPSGPVRAQVVALPDADVSPEMLAGLAPGLPPEAHFARRLAEAGCRVLVPTLIDRGNTWSGNPAVRMTNQTHREFIYRQAYFMGRHIIGYEVQKVLAAVDYFTRQNQERRGAPLPIGVVGHGEGGLVALYSAAVDPRIDATLVSGYFGPREDVWQEPVYRNVWGLLHEFGDAEIAGLIAPRPLIVEASRGPEVPGPPPPRNGRMDAASGRLVTPPLPSVRAEFERARVPYRRLGLGDRIRLVVSRSGSGPPGSDAALQAFFEAVGIAPSLSEPAPHLLEDRRASFDPAGRMKRQYDQLVAYTQERMRLSPRHRAAFWAQADSTSPLARTPFRHAGHWSADTTFPLARWQEITRPYRDYLWKEVVGWMPPPSLAPNARTRLLYETPRWKGYEVVMDVWPGVINYGVLLVPKDLRPEERRPVVVVQHGRGGRPQRLTNPEDTTGTYRGIGARLADRGFVVYAPQNLYIGEETYRQLQRKANPLKLTFFGPMVRQHEQVLRWLGGLPFVDTTRIGFYGLSYGGKSAVIIPALLEGYALSISSGDFNETVRKHVSIDSGYSFMFTEEHEHTEFDFGEKFNYAELAGLIAPRPFMVERGHYDPVAPDEWVAYEYARVRWLYNELGIGDRTEIEFFNGGHEINAHGTVDFLHRHLAWPQP